VLVLVLATAGLAAGCGEAPRPNAQQEADPTLRSLPEGGAEIAASRVDPLFAEAAEEITDDRFDFEVRCWTEGDWNEILAFWGPELAGTEDAVVAAFVAGLSDVQLSPEVCGTLTRFAYGPPRFRRGRPSPETALAVVVFAHEIGHTVIGSNEAATECWAVQRAKTVARVFGATEATATAVGRVYLREHYPELPPGYQSAECHDGGALDLAPESSVWP
ncbi:MAG: hypothetical protein ACRDOG_08845, partial [Gaiellaceae bacterium]